MDYDLHPQSSPNGRSLKGRRRGAYTIAGVFSLLGAMVIALHPDPTPELILGAAALVFFPVVWSYLRLRGPLSIPPRRIGITPRGIVLLEEGERERVYAWESPSLSLTLFDGTNASYHVLPSLRGTWNLLEPRRRMTQIPKECYEELIREARSRGLLVEHRTPTPRDFGLVKTTIRYQTRITMRE